MIIESRHFGNIEIDKESIIHFEKGVYGFEELHSFVLLGKVDDEENPFKWLHSVDDPNVCFVIIDPKQIEEDYSLTQTENIMKKLKTDDLEKCLIYAIVVIPDNIEGMTANLKSPIIVNVENNLGMQIILDDDKYQIKHKIIRRVKKGA